MAIPQEKTGHRYPEMRWLGVAGIELRAKQADTRDRSVCDASSIQTYVVGTHSF